MAQLLVRQQSELAPALEAMAAVLSRPAALVIPAATPSQQQVLAALLFELGRHS
jgi:hypothetical protein